MFMKKGLTLLASSVGEYSICKMGSGSVEDWVPGNEEKRWHGLGLVSGLIKRINQTIGVVKRTTNGLGGGQEILSGAGLVLFAFWTSREGKKNNHGVYFYKARPTEPTPALPVPGTLFRGKSNDREK